MAVWCWCRPQCSAVEILLRAGWQLWRDNCSIVTSPLWETRWTFPNFSKLKLDEENYYFLHLGNKSVSSAVLHISLTPQVCHSAGQHWLGSQLWQLSSLGISTQAHSRPQHNRKVSGSDVRLPHYPTFPPGLLSIFIIGKLKWEIFVSKIVHKNYLKDKIIYTALVYSNFGLNSSLKVLNFFQGP